MSLRRTGIARKSELRRRTPMPRGKRELRARTIRTIRRNRDTGPSVATRNLVLERACGCCELCGKRLHDGTEWLPADRSYHHRQPRGGGGTSRPEANAAYNLLLLCGSGTDGCHGFIEKHRRAAEEEGWLVRHGQDPADVPVTVWSYAVGWDPAGSAEPATRRVLLTVDGDYLEVAA